MNGKLVVRLVEAALDGKAEQVRVLANMISNELRTIDPDLSMQLAKSCASPLRGVRSRINPHPINSNAQDERYLINESGGLSEVEEPILAIPNRGTFEQIIKEHHNVKKLISNSLEPTKTLIFTGPPGVGKTITAKWLAKKLNLKFKILDLAFVMDSHLGKTGNNLKSVIDAAASTPCVLLLDEFDAIAKKRGDDNDIGEIKRLVTVLLQAIDSWPYSSILIAATNHPELLDPAIWRRFEVKVEFDLPNKEQVQEYLWRLTGLNSIKPLHALFDGLSFSDIKTEIQSCRKFSIINNVDLLTQIINSKVNDLDVSKLTMEEKKKLAVCFVRAGFSQRSVVGILDISRPTIKSALEEKGVNDEK